MEIRQAVKGKEPRVGSVRFIAIDGHGGSGKSTLSHMLSDILGAQVIHTDDFASWENPKDWWSSVVERVVEPVRAGATILNYPRSKWWEGHTPEPVVNQPVTNIMILEGVGSLQKELRSYVSYGIFVDTPKSICLQRGFERDQGQDGKTDEEIRKMWEKWYSEEEAYMIQDNPKAFANLVVDGTKSFKYQISNLQ